MYIKNDFKDVQQFTYFLDGLLKSKVEFVITYKQDNAIRYISQNEVIQVNQQEQDHFNKNVLDALQYVYLSSDLEYQEILLSKNCINYNSHSFSAIDIINDTIYKYTQLLDNKLLLNNVELLYIPVSSESLFSYHTKDLPEVQPIMQYLIKLSIKIINSPISFSDAISKIQSLVAREFNRINKALLFYICVADFNIDYILHSADSVVILDTLRAIAGSGKENIANTLRASCTARYHNLQQNQSTELLRNELDTIRELFCKLYDNAYDNLSISSQFNIHLVGGCYGLDASGVFSELYNTKFSIKEIIDRDRKIMVAYNVASPELTQQFNHIFNINNYLRAIQK